MGQASEMADSLQAWPCSHGSVEGKYSDMMPLAEALSPDTSRAGDLVGPPRAGPGPVQWERASALPLLRALRC